MPEVFPIEVKLKIFKLHGRKIQQKCRVLPRLHSLRKYEIKLNVWIKEMMTIFTFTQDLEKRTRFDSSARAETITLFIFKHCPSKKVLVSFAFK